VDGLRGAPLFQPWNGLSAYKEPLLDFYFLLSSVLPTQHYFSNAVGSVDFVPNGYVYLHWSGAPLSSLEFRGLYTHARNLLKRHQLHGILADHRAMPDAPTDQDREWLLKQWLPQTVAQTGFVHYAVLPATDPANRLHTGVVMRDLEHYVKVSLFDDLEQAASWIATAQ
jgi:NhaA family Na+:H+ antiporter